MIVLTIAISVERTASLGGTRRRVRRDPRRPGRPIRSPVSSGPPDMSGRGAVAGYGVRTGALALSDSHSLVIASRLPSLFSAAIAALTHDVRALPLART